MIFTIGNYPSYEQYFDEQTTPRKLGRTDDYGGGIAFGSVDEATAYINTNYPNNNYAVYGLDCDWTNTYWSQEDHFFRIIESTNLIKVE